MSAQRKQMREHCTEHPDKEATAYCSKCKKFLCEECENRHMRRFEFMSHKSYVTKDFETDSSVFAGKCEKHPAHTLDFMCKTHWTLCCSECRKDDEAHKSCLVVPLKNIEIKIVNGKYEKTKRDYMERVERAKELPLEKLGQREELFTAELERITEKITDHFAKLREAINKKEGELLAKLEGIRSENSISSFLRDIDESKSGSDDEDFADNPVELKRVRYVS